MRIIKIGLVLGLLGLAGFGQAQAQDTYGATKYPIVLVHGLFGFNSILGVDYFYGIAADLQTHGASVYTTEVSSVNSSDIRGEQLVTQVSQILAVSGASKVNLVGHSQGAQTIRYAAAALPGKVASVTSVDGVILGSSVADFVLSLEAATGGVITPVINSLLNGLGLVIDSASGQGNLPQDAQASLTVLSTAGSTAFNKRFPAGVPTTACGDGAAVVNGVGYYSWTGNKISTNVFDISDPILALAGAAFGATPNDGLVAICASHLGKVIGDQYDMNHLDAVNQVLGLVGTTDPVALFRQHANRLKLAGN